MANLTRWEKETIINWNQESDQADVYTRDEAVMRKLDKLCAEYPDLYKKIKETDIDKEYICPKNFIHFKHPSKRTEEQRQAARERGKMIYEKYLKPKQEEKRSEK